MPVAVYKLRIRDTPGDDSAWQEARVVAASVAEALVQAQQRFGEDRVMAIAQDAVGEPLTGEDAEPAALAADGAPVVYADAIVARPPADALDPAARAQAFADAAAGHIDDVAFARDPVASAPMPWEGRWRPAVLLWIGVAAGIVAFAISLGVGNSGRDRFVTAAPTDAGASPGLPLDGTAPSGGVLAATGMRVRPRDDDEPRFGDMVGEAVASTDADLDPDTAEQVRSIGTAVGDLFARTSAENAPPPPMPPSPGIAPGPVSAPIPPPPPGALPPMPDASLPPLGGTPPVREAAMLRPFFVQVERAGQVQTLRVPAYDADHARAIITDLPDR